MIAVECTQEFHHALKRAGALSNLRPFPEAHRYIGECPECSSPLFALRPDEGGLMPPPTESVGPEVDDELELGRAAGSEHDHDQRAPHPPARLSGGTPRAGRRRPPRAQRDRVRSPGPSPHDLRLAELLAAYHAPRFERVPTAVFAENRDRKSAAARRAVAEDLRERGWPVPRIARVLGKKPKSVHKLLRGPRRAQGAPS